MTPTSMSPAQRLLPVLASLLAVVVDRKRLVNDALETEALRRSDTIKTAVLHAVSHDLRSPLTAIRVASDGLTDETLVLTVDARRELLDTIGVEVHRLERVVHNLPALSRLHAGAITPIPEIWTVEDLVFGSLADIRRSTERASVSVAADTPLRFSSTPSRCARSSAT